MYSFTITTGINAPPERVWRALCDPMEVVRWDTGVVEPIDAPADYPRPGQHVRWRYSNGPFRTLHDRPQEVAAERTLRSLISIGPLRFDETYTLEPGDSGTRLSAAMRVFVPLLLGGPLTERLYAGPESRRTVEASMRSLKSYCEQ
jgi:uncharacterized protein YndB with AHSA1/START domain